MTRPLAILVLILAALAAACGSATEEAPTPEATSSSAQSVAPSVTPSATASPEAAPVMPAVVTDKDGKQVRVADVSRIVVLNGDITEVVYALGLGDRVVGVDQSATYPAEARAKQNIGYQARLSAEGIVALNPTVIIGKDGAGPPEVIEQIGGIGVPVVLLPDVKSIEGVAAKINAVAQALGVPNRGRALAEQTSAEIATATALAARATSHPTIAFLYLRGATTQMMGGKGTRADILIEQAGGVDAGVRAGIEDYKPITPEALVTANPDIILVMDAGLDSVGGIEGLLGIPGIAETPAGRDRRVVHFDDQYLLGLGPRTGKLLEELVRAVHPELVAVR
jgi:iron complex transport system substrate-binding protein